MEKELPKRKSTRLQGFDYRSAGAYFVTICTGDRKQILSEIVQTNLTGNGKATNSAVGEGLAPPEYLVKLKPCGEIAEDQLRLIENRFPSVSIENFVIMPNHIHMVVFLHEKAGGASPSPTLSDVICAFKSLTSRICKQSMVLKKSFNGHMLSILFEIKRIMKHEEDIYTKILSVGITMNYTRKNSSVFLPDMNTKDKKEGALL